MRVHISFENHGPCCVALVALKGHPARVYHFSKTSGQGRSWALRDYLIGSIVRSSDSVLTATEIENMVSFADRAAYRSVKRISNWNLDCQAAAQRHYGAGGVDLTTPNPVSTGNWRPMDRNGS